MVDPTPAFSSQRDQDTLIVLPLGHSLQFAPGAVESQTGKLIEILDEPEIQHVVVDLQKVSMLDSIVIGAIIAFANRARKQGGQACLCHVSKRMQETLNYVRIDQMMTQHETREDAMASIRG